MKRVFSFFFLFLLMVIALVLQDILSIAVGMYQIHLFLVPIVFCFGAIALTRAAALYFAVITGLLEGLLVLPFHAHRPEIGITWFVLFFMTWVLLLQGAIGLTDGIRWELHALGSALFTASLLTGEWLMISWHCGFSNITSMTLMLIVIPSALSLLLSPLLYYSLQFLLPSNYQRAASS